MTVTQRWLVLLGATGLVAIGWLAQGLSAGAPRPGGQLSLLEILEEISRPPAAPPGGRRAVPAPPPQPPWRSPLARRCTPADPSRRDRLLSLLARVRQAPLRVRIDPSNYGQRFERDAFGNRLDPTPRLVVLHETVYGMGSALNTFATPHPRDEDQVSYHTLISESGQVVQVLDPRLRAYGAGNSAFNGQWVVSNPQLGGSVNNFALHLSLETPLDGENGAARHSGYTAAQYDALAAVLADWMGRFPIRPEQITTHRAVDLGGERSDPRSFDWRALEDRLADLGLLC